MLDGVTSYLGISCVLTGDSEKGFSVDQERTIANIGLTIAKDRFEMKFSSAETWNLKPNRLDDLTAYETLSVK